MRVLIFGKSGQVAQELARRCPADIEAVFLGRDELDLSEPERISDALSGLTFDIAINAAAWTAVDQAEDDEAAATVLNGEAPGVLAGICAERDAPFLHVSTDYVFDGTGSSPFRETDPTSPVNAYGRSKLAGEDAVRNAGGRHAILRTSWIFSPFGANFVKTMLRLGQSRSDITVVADQFGGPTSAGSIATALYKVGVALTDGHGGGTYHFSGAPHTNWASFARAIMSRANLSCQVSDITSDQYITKAARPKNSRLDCSKIKSDFNIDTPSWEDDLKHTIHELGEDS